MLRTLAVVSNGEIVFVVKPEDNDKPDGLNPMVILSAFGVQVILDDATSPLTCFTPLILVNNECPEPGVSNVNVSCLSAKALLSAADAGFNISLVLSTLPSPTSDFVNELIPIFTVVLSASGVTVILPVPNKF